MKVDELRALVAAASPGKRGVYAGVYVQTPAPIGSHWPNETNPDPTLRVTVSQARANAELDALSPDLALLLADAMEALEEASLREFLLLNGWEVRGVSLYDEEGIEGWEWRNWQGEEWTEMGDWSEYPPIPDGLREVAIKAGWKCAVLERFAALGEPDAEV